MQRIGRYEVVRSLGKGGMGQVFLARDPKLERSLAIKLLSHDDNPDARGLFEREAKVLAALSHPNIVTIFEIAESDDRQFIAMEYLPGRSLRDLLIHDRPSREALLAICGQVATALAAAHEAGILHRDIKPENVVVGKDHGVKVVDFGIARRLDAPSFDPSTTRRKAEPKDAEERAAELVDVFTRTIRVDALSTVPSTTGRAVAAVDTQPDSQHASATRTVFGTPAYMAPEVLMGSPSSTASDVYSLGVMLHECLTGRRPYDAPNLHEVIARVIDGDEPPARIDDPLAELIARMLARDPAARPSLAEISKALARQRSTVAAVPSKRRWVVAAAAIAVLVTAGIVVWRLRAPSAASATQRAVTIQDIEVRSPSYGSHPPHPLAVGRVVSFLVADMGAHVIADEEIRQEQPAVTAETWSAAALKLGAHVMARCTIIEEPRRLIALLEIVDLHTGQVTRQEITGTIGELSPLLNDVAVAIASAVGPSAQLDPARARSRASSLLQIGATKLHPERWYEARPFIEQAVNADPTLPGVWDMFGMILDRTGAPPARVIAAQERAIAAAPAEPRKRIQLAALLNTRRQHAAALVQLAALEGKQLSRSEQLDAMYQTGDAHWHEGRHDRGFDYFRRILEIEPKYTLAAQHAGEYAMARRKGDVARGYLALQQIDTWADAVDFALGNYERVAGNGKFPYNAWAQLVLGRPLSPSPTALDETTMSLERLAIAAGEDDRTTAAKEVNALIARARARTLTGGTLYELSIIGEVVVGMALPDETKLVLEQLRDHDGYHYKRFAILAAPYLGKPSFERAQLTERLARLQDAIEAELAGDRRHAADLLTELIHDPTSEWDYPERIALVRNLRALGDAKALAEVCRDTLHPAIMRYAFRVARRRCLER